MEKGRRRSSFFIIIVFALVLFVSAAGEADAQTAGQRTVSLYVEPSSVPPYSGSPYVSINGNIPGFTDQELTTEAFESYSNLDGLGRCGVCYANIGREIMPTEDRGAIGMVKPTGWSQAKYPGIVDSDPPYLYNRCHLIGYQLSAENANTRNLITGTRYMNVEGMLPFENMVANYVQSTNNHVLYRVTPVFEGNNLLCSGVEMEARSVEDNGSGVCFHVFVYNVQPGIVIDYATGNSSPANGASANEPAQEEPVQRTLLPEAAAATVQQESALAEGTPSSCTYILNKNTGVFHYPSCKSVNQMKEKNKIYSTQTRDEIAAQGYKSCGNCHP